MTSEAGRDVLRAVVGTAGHIDHGKTALVQALTGVDCDRLAEEKERGITIDLGFAGLALAADSAAELPLQLGFVDVPGHERFVRNMLAGIGGIDVALLVVAADESVKPQTREHLAICDVLAIPAGVVALTKSDLVDADMLELVRLEVEELCRGTFLAGAPIVAVSARTGSGLAELREALAAAARRRAGIPRRHLPLRLPLDRAFTLKGFGAVVTGSLVDGEVGAEAEIEILPERLRARVRSVEVHDERRERARSGERTSLNLAGVELAELRRGQMAAAPGVYETSPVLTVEVTALAGLDEPLPDGQRVRLHHFASETLGTLHLIGRKPLERGETAFAQIRLQEPVPACAGDRFVLRRATPLETIAGGRVLDPLQPKWKHGGGSDRESLRVLAHGTLAERLELVARQAGAAGFGLDGLVSRTGAAPHEIGAALAQLQRDGSLVALPGTPSRWLGAVVLQRLAAEARAALGEHAQGDALGLGMPRSTFVQRLLPRGPAALAERLLALLAAAGEVRPDQDRVFPPGAAAAPGQAEGELAERVSRMFAERGLDPPSLAEVAEQIGHKKKVLEGMIFYLAKRGDLVKLPGGTLLHRDAVATVAASLRERGGELDIAEFKERFALTRKLAIPLLEHLDATRVTVRVGDRRRVR